MKIDLEKANAAIDEYLANLRDPNVSSRRVASLYWVKICLERHGVIADFRKLDLTDHCVLFIACVIACKRVREVSRTEVEHRAVNKGRSLEGTIRKWRKAQSRLPYWTRIERHLADTRSKVQVGL